MMTDWAIVARPGEATGTPVLDPATGLYPEVQDELIYTGIASVRIPGTLSTGKLRPTAGDSAALLSAIFAIPWNAPRVQVGDKIMIAASAFNPNLVGLVYTATGMLPGSQVTKQKVTIEAVVD